MQSCRKLTVWVAVICSLAVSGCDPTNSATRLNDLKGTSWEVTGIPKRVTATMSFGADGRVTGTSGCNRYFSTYKISGQAIEISNIGSTRKICPEVEMSVERELLKSLAIVNRWHGMSDKMELTATVNKTTVRLKRAQ